MSDSFEPQGEELFSKGEYADRIKTVEIIKKYKERAQALGRSLGSQMSDKVAQWAAFEIKKAVPGIESEDAESSDSFMDLCYGLGEEVLEGLASSWFYDFRD